MTGKNNEDLLNIYDENDSSDLFSIGSDSKKVDSKDLDSGESTLNFEEIKSNSEELDIVEAKESVEAIKELEPKIDSIEEELDDGFMDEINELKDEGEKKSLFGNIFKRKKKEDNGNDEIETENKKEDENEASSNIFDDFNQDESLLDEVSQIKQERDRDMYYYFNKVGKISQVIFVLLLLLLGILYSYIYVQNKVFVGEDKDNQLLGPICFVLLNGVNYEGDFCTSITTLKEDYTIKLANTKENQISKILNVVKVVYEIENFTKTKDVIFLSDKTEGKLKILKVLEEFDKLKNEFAKVDKQTIQCKGIKITQKDDMLTMTCEAYSAGFESGIRGFDGKNEPGSLLKGTSISIANSFLNFISLESKVFTIVDRQRLFKSDSVIGGKTGFTSKTPFTLKLKYNLD